MEAVITCSYIITSTDDSGEHTMQCSRCNGIMRSQYQPTMVHTICVLPPTPDEVLPKVRYDLGTAIDDDDWPEVSRRATACCGCPKFSGYGCAELGKRCRTGRLRWLERLVMGECDVWV